MLEAPAKRFTDRRAAGRALAARLAPLAREHPLVVGLARGGVPVGSEVARALGAQLDVLVVRKIGAPGNPEYGIGAVAEGGVRAFNEDALGGLLVSHEELETAVARAEAQIDVRTRRYRRGRPPLDVQGRTVIVVDDGLATGGTARAAVRAVRARGARSVVLAVPVGAPRTVESLRAEADVVVCVLEPDPMWAVGAWYDDFRPTDDAEVLALLDGAAGDPGASAPRAGEARIPVGEGRTVVGDLTVPERALGLVVFAHGSGSSRHSPRNRQVAAALNGRGLATLLLDLLTPDEERDRRNVFDIGLLAERLVAATRWARSEPALASLRLGYFGASTGAGAALWAAAELGDGVGAVVSRGGRPDLAAPRLAEVRAPVLLIVGGHDEVVLELNRDAQRQLPGSAELEIVPGATHLFEEPGALDAVARLAGDWLVRHLGAPG
ncbi:MAG TPA: phosphoribosyltransferase family protein [Solirubrobacteraceae bacterium]|nr:phosphoribosyltransferase family protein [Solirubrobacteraceae bacterium]